LIRAVLVALPLVLLAGLIAVFALNIDRDPSLVRSVLIDKPAPAFDLPAVAGLDVPGFDTAALRGHVTIVNVFASWCVPCRDEHPVLTELKARAGVPLYGIDQRDAPQNAAAFLAELGNPYDRIGADADNRVSIDWGVYGVPETFVVAADGVIAYKHVGPISPQSLEAEVLPAIEKVKAGESGSPGPRGSTSSP
jgi:cytochrome c biogenesis protein CcmG/thiol:disulfide interchange protein DsbE